MISIPEAKNKLSSNIAPLPPVKVSISDAFGMVLAEDVRAAIDSPAFDRSAMDGFAVRHKGGERFPISQTIKASDVPKPLEKGTCAKIMTGAMIPDGADTVIPIEDAKEEGGFVSFAKEITRGQFVRKRGSELKTGDVLLRKGAVLTPAAIALLASQGITEFFVHRTPSVAILTTGDEVIRPHFTSPSPLVGEGRGEGEMCPVVPCPAQIYDANFSGLAAAISELKIETSDLGIARDNPEILRKKISEGLSREVFIISGGVSVGEFDYVKNILSELGVKEIFWRVAQKPGKPLYFGVAGGRKAVFGIPGNPAAALVCAYEYILPAIRKMMGHSEIWPRETSAKLAAPINWKRDRTEFVRGIYDFKKQTVSPIKQDESYMLKGFAEANCLIVAERLDFYEPHEDVVVHLL